MSDDLVEWLRAQLDADQEKATAATPGPWRWVDPGGRIKQALVAPGYPYQFVLPSAMGDAYPLVADAEHIAAWDPARVLREVEAKRKILGEYDAALANLKRHPDDLAGKGWLLATVRVVKLLAPLYSDRPGYRQEWTP